MGYHFEMRFRNDIIGARELKINLFQEYEGKREI